MALGSDAFTAQGQALGMVYRETLAQAQLLAYSDDFWVLMVMFAAVPLFLPFMRRIRMDVPAAEDVASARPSAAHAAEPAG